METLKGTHIKLRALEPEDLGFLFDTENDEANWQVSGTQVPFSKFILKQYLDNSHKDIYEAKQLRLVIAAIDSNIPMGMIDLFDFDPQHKRAGIGILVSETYRNKGTASEALQLLISYAFHYLDLHQLYANVTTDNTTSMHLFEKHGFELIGIKKDWIYSQHKFMDEASYQLISPTAKQS